MPSISDAWNEADHPRGAGQRFVEKTHSPAEVALAVAEPPAPADLLVPAVDGVPYTQRVAEGANPVLAGFLRAQADGDASPQEWLDAIDAYFDDPETAPRGDLHTHVRELFGTPRNEGDVDDWYRRTAGWRAQAEQAIRSAAGEFDDVEIDEVPNHSNDSGDWCPYSGTMTQGGECPQGCRQASDPDYDFDDDED